MGKVEINKETKRTSLLKESFDLFVNQGFAKTTISDIVKKSGIAKGTFYLYFKDKYDLRDQIVARKSTQILQEAQEALKVRPEPIHGFEEYLFALVDYILNYLSRNKTLLKFISKNLSWGLFRSAYAVEQTETEEDRALNAIYKDYLQALKDDHISCEEPELMLYTIVELVGSTAYSCILNNNPVDLKTYTPYLHRCIHQIICGFSEPAEA